MCLRVCVRERDRERGGEKIERERRDREATAGGREEGRERKRASENLCITVAK